MNIFYSNTLNARVRRTLSWIGHSFYLDTGGDHTKSVFVCGSGRSGTTWLFDVLNFDRSYRPMIEPFTRGLVPICRAFSPRQYVRPESADPTYLEPATAIFTGAVRHAFIDQATPPMIVHRRLIKDVRTTLMLKWARDHFPGMPILYILRHPCAVALSRQKLGWRTDLDRAFLDQPDLVNRHLQPFVDVVGKASSTFERHLIDWCVENFVPLAELAHRNVHIAFYENLCADPESELRKIYAYLGRPFPPAVLDSLHLPSKSPKTDTTTFADTRDVVGKWREQITADDRATAARVTKLFGLDQIYGDDVLVDLARFERWRTPDASRPAGAAADTPT